MLYKPTTRTGGSSESGIPLTPSAPAKTPRLGSSHTLVPCQEDFPWWHTRKQNCGNLHVSDNTCVCDKILPGLVNLQKAIEAGLPIRNWWIFPVRYVSPFTRGWWLENREITWLCHGRTLLCSVTTVMGDLGEIVHIVVSLYCIFCTWCLHVCVCTRCVNEYLHIILDMK
jgi:hypothetical protein